MVSPIVSDLVRDYVERHQWTARRLPRRSVAVAVLGHEEDAYAARRRAGGGPGGGPGALLASLTAVALVAAGIAALSFRTPGGAPHPGIGGKPPTLARVAGLQGASPTTTAPAITWRAVPGAHSYIVYRNGARIDVRAGLRYVDTSAKHGTYTYRVAAVAHGSDGPPSAGKTIVFQGAEPPSSAIRLDGLSPTSSPPSFSWNAVAKSEAYAVYRGGVRIQTTGAPHYVDHVPQGTYRYQVASIRGPVESKLSRPLTIVYTATTQGAGVPTGLHAVGPITEPPSLSWHEVPGADHYVVYRDSRRVATALRPEYRDSTVQRDTYAYRVSAVVAGVEGDPSESVLVQYALEAPVLSTLANPTNHPPRFSWTAVPGAVRYVVYRGGQEVTQTSNQGFADTKGLAEGTYAYEVAGLDSHGNPGSRGTLTIVYDRTPPPTPTGFGSASSDPVNRRRSWYSVPG